MKTQKTNAKKHIDCGNGLVTTGTTVRSIGQAHRDYYARLSRMVRKVRKVRKHTEKIRKHVCILWEQPGHHWRHWHWEFQRVWQQYDQAVPTIYTCLRMFFACFHNLWTFYIFLTIMDSLA